MTSLVYSTKAAFIEIVSHEIPLEFQPKYIFAHSSSDRPNGHGPGYRVLFDGRVKLKQSQGPIQNKIRQIAMDLFNGKEGFDPARLEIDFSDVHDPGMSGAYRED